ncbi:MAG: type II secretion system protein [Lactobacillales bacterium]|nr:type II secretion system protein [Lactobacillales bacterium]
MNKKGFTLIELLAVIVILGLVALVAITTVSGAIKSYKNSLYQNQINNIESAAHVWGSDHMLLLPNDSSTTGSTCEYENINNCPTSYNKLILNLSVLQDGGYIDKDLKSVKTKKAFDNLEIVITKNGKKLEYEVIDQTYYVYEIGDEITVQLNDSDSMNFYVIEDSKDNTKYVKAISVEPLSTDNVAWCSECTTNINGPTTINENLSLLGWNNVTEKRLITNDEFTNIINTLQNNSDADKTWVSGNYWTSTTNGTTSAYYVNATSELIEDQITNSHQIRPVIKISKTYVKLK